jgi:2-phospho-L-lactate guanylyltransferase
VVVPVKAFARAKVRLAPALSAPEREDLARRMAEQVLRAAAPLPVTVVCDEEDVRAWAGAHGARVVWCPGRGLNGAVADGVAALAAEGIDRVIVAHADLPLARSLAWLAQGAEGVTLVPDRRDDGTNVACVPSRAGFRFGYGPGSFDRHRVEAARLGLPLRVVRDPALGWDVDVPADLDYDAHRTPTALGGRCP